MVKVNEESKAKLLQELMLDMNWDAAAKRVGLTKDQLILVKRNKKFMELAESKLNKAMGDQMDAEGALKRFRETQKFLEKAIRAGELGVASSLIKSHEMEFRLHGLFEKDNQQKSAPMQINISLSDPAKTIEGKATEIMQIEGGE